MAYDAAFGLMRWYGLLQAAPFDVTLDPDPADIGRDIVNTASWWRSPVQYLAPGALILRGPRAGTAIALIPALSISPRSSTGVGVARAFALAPRLAVVATALVVALRLDVQGVALLALGSFRIS